MAKNGAIINTIENNTANSQTVKLIDNMRHFVDNRWCDCSNRD
jgi:hypothetical protein